MQNNALSLQYIKKYCANIIDIYAKKVYSQSEMKKKGAKWLEKGF